MIVFRNAVIKDRRTWEWLKLKTKVLCFEIEAVDLMMDFFCIIIHGICDYIDLYKNKQ